MRDTGNKIPALPSPSCFCRVLIESVLRILCFFDPHRGDVCMVPEVSHAALGASDQVEADRHLEAPRPVVLLVQGQRTLQESI